MTKIQLIESLLDYIINLMMENSDDFENFNVNNFRRIFSNGNIVQTDNVEDVENIVVYQQDYQQQLTPESLDTVLNSAADCQFDTETNQYLDWGDFSYFVTYNGPDDPDFENYDASLNPDSVPFVEIEMQNCALGEFTFFINLTEELFTFLANFISFSNQNYVIDIDKAKQILDTNIFELIPVNITRQARINKFFTEYESLKGVIPNFSLDVDSDDIPDTWATNVSANQDIHHNVNDIQVTEPNQGNIVRLDRHAENTINEGQTLQSLRDDLNEYLTDIDKVVEIQPEDERPEYEPQSEGYLRINGLNQGIIIRQEESDNLPFIGSDQYNPVWLVQGFTIAMWVKFLNKTSTGTLFNLGNPFQGYTEDGDYDESICNGGDPGECLPGQIKPSFALQTFTLNKNDLVKPDGSYGTWEQYVNNEVTVTNGFTEDINHFTSAQPFFKKTDDERFIRLIVRDQYGSFWDSHVGKSRGRNGHISSRLTNLATTMDLPVPGVAADYSVSGTETSCTGRCYSRLINHTSIKPFDNYYAQKVLNHLHVPSDINEWYYIVANWNPNIQENRKLESCGSTGNECGPDALTSQAYFDEYWKWHVDFGADGEEGIQATEADINSNSDLLVGTEADPCPDVLEDDPNYPHCYKNVGRYTHNSFEGAKCKVEIISKSDLLRAKGFKV